MHEKMRKMYEGRPQHLQIPDLLETAHWEMSNACLL